MINSGFININKPTGMTSFEVVGQIKKALKVKHIGHLGTLDPAASGVLPIAIGKATKFFDFFLKKDKEYIALAEFGVQTDTLDSFGNITKIDDERVITDNEISRVLPKFIGKIEQTPPKFSAVKINGKKAYELARENKDFEIKKRQIEVFNIKFQPKTTKNAFLFDIHCSAGTYIRTLICDIANSLGTVATTSVIIRKRSGLFDINSSIPLNEFLQNPKIMSYEQVFKYYNFFDVGSDDFQRLKNGAKINLSGIKNFSPKRDEPFFLKYRCETIGLYKADGEKTQCLVFLCE